MHVSTDYVSAGTSKRQKVSPINTLLCQAQTGTDGHNGSAKSRKQAKLSIIRGSRLKARSDQQLTWTAIAIMAELNSICNVQHALPSTVLDTSDVHPSHSLFAVRMFVFCQTCGYWRHKRAMALAKPCKGFVACGQKSKLCRMFRGLHPESRKCWPDGVDACHPSEVYRIPA